MAIKLSCAFATSNQSHEHARIAESLGYERAWFYDSPALYPDVWVHPGRAAERTSRIGLGPGVPDPDAAPSDGECGRDRDAGFDSGSGARRDRRRLRVHRAVNSRSTADEMVVERPRVRQCSQGVAARRAGLSGKALFIQMMRSGGLRRGATDQGAPSSSRRPARRESRRRMSSATEFFRHGWRLRASAGTSL